MEQINRRIARGQLNESEQQDLWDCVSLTAPEINELLDHVQKSVRHAFVHPMFAFAAHTGARRSEILRSEVDDIDFEAMTITIREMKRVRGCYSTRTVPMSSFLAKTIRPWLDEHPDCRRPPLGTVICCVSNPLSWHREALLDMTPNAQFCRARLLGVSMSLVLSPYRMWT